MRLRLFIYGSCGAGKTSFFRQLIQGNGLQIASNSKLAKFMSSSISPSGQVIPTTTGVDGLEIKLDRNAYIISDWKGEILSASINELASTNLQWFNRSRNLIANQIVACNAILFFFDPSAQSTAGSIRSLDQIQKHHCDELLRAKQLIDFVLRARQNRFTPVLFILTHCDLLDVIPQLSALTEKWVDTVNRYLTESYDEFFCGYYPKSLTCREQLFFYVTTIHESKQPRKTIVPQTGAIPPAKVDAMNWVETFPFAVDLANILRNVQKHVNLIAAFYRDDRKSYRSVLILFAFCLCVVFLTPLIINMPQTQSFIGDLQKNLPSLFDRAPQLKSIFNAANSSVPDMKLNLQALENPAELDGKNAAVVNESLNILMRRLNKLEDDKKNNTDDYKKQFAQWTTALQKIERLFDTGNFENNRVKLDLFGVLLGKLTDSPMRVTPQLDGVLKKYWNLYREMLTSELAEELQVNRDAGLTSKQQIEMLCSRLERFFREINNSNVRGDSFTLKSNNTANKLKESNPKELLKQDIRKTFKSCENFLVSYPVEIRFRDVSYSSEVGIDRDFMRRLKISGIDSNPVYIDLTISSGYRNDKVCQFLPVKDRITVLLNLNSNIQISLEQINKTKNNNNEKIEQNNQEQIQEQIQNQNQNQNQNRDAISGWHEFITWQIDPQPNKNSLEKIGIKFYLQFENETNTNYTCNGEGMKIQLEIKRPRSIPNLLWEIIKYAEQ
ncbi:MAG: GTPase domain-containing protein [Planctomycetaceae bacterium]|jgi:hypothetical protein|nr:GTPase domain-containing protein [Planctomycetaceae bacterium]